MLLIFTGTRVFMFPSTGLEELLESTTAEERMTWEDPFVANIEDRSVLSILQEAAFALIRKDVGKGERASMHEFLDGKDFCHTQRSLRVHKRAHHTKRVDDDDVTYDRVKAINNTVKSGRTRGGYYVSKVISEKSLSGNLTRRVDEPLLSGANLSFLRKWDNARTLRYGGGVMHSSIHFDFPATLIVQLHGKREMFLLHPSCDIPTEENKHKSDFRQLCARFNMFGFKQRQLRMRDMHCKSHRMKKVALEPGRILYIPSKWYHSVESNSMWWISYTVVYRFLQPRKTTHID